MLLYIADEWHTSKNYDRCALLAKRILTLDLLERERELQFKEEHEEEKSLQM